MMSKINVLKNADISNKKTFIRLDLNVPIKNGKIVSTQRIVSAIPTIKWCIENNAKVVLMSHLGRPKEGVYEEKFSLKLVADYLSEALNQPVRLVKNWLSASDFHLKKSEVVLLENVRFNNGELANDQALSKAMASLCDVFVMDAFGTAHRAQASTVGVAKYAKKVCAGPLLMDELSALGKAIENPAHPLLALVGGSKVSSKLSILSSLSNQVDVLITGGGITNTFIASSGYQIGKSLYEKNLMLETEKLLGVMKDRQATIPIPIDVIVAKSIDDNAVATCKKVEDVAHDDFIVDIGPQSVAVLVEKIMQAKTIVWNGPVGIFEIEQFSQGTRQITEAIASSSAFSIAGGGDTLAAIEKFGKINDISYISTGGGAFLEFLEGKKLPAISVLEERFEH